MFDILFSPLFSDSFGFTDYIISAFASLLLGALLALVHRRNMKSNPSYLLTLILMPLVTQTVIMMVNGNIGTGIAVAGAFGFVRFRSMQYKAEDILLIFVAVAIGLATSIGYIGFAALFTIIVVSLVALFGKTIGSTEAISHRELRITVPEGVNYEEAFNDLFSKYASSCELLTVKTTNMGSLYKLTYDIVLRDYHNIQEFINELRIRNGNLEIALGIFPEVSE